MKILAIHSDYISFRPTKKALKSAEDVKLVKKTVKECLVVFTAVEQEDESKETIVAKKLSEEVKNIAEQVKTDTIVLYPYAHLSSSLSKPDSAAKVLKETEKILKKHFKTSQAPFGWYKAFEIKCKGHPLSELSRNINALEKNKTKEKEEQKFKFENRVLSKEEKVKLTLSFAIAKAVKDIFPESEIGSSGFYHDNSYIDIYGIKLYHDDLNRITKTVKQILKQNLSIGKTKKAAGIFQEEILRDLKKADAYKLDNISIVPLFADPFLESTKDIEAFKIINMASAYWKNNTKNKQLVRIYSAAFDSRKKLDNFLKKQEEAKKRDHRVLGKQLKLFSTHDEAPGMPFFHDNGTIIFNHLEVFMEEEMRKLGYELNKTPIILNKKLWLQSGHWEHYKENMYFTKIDSEDYAVKPMNCPGNILIFKDSVHSYRELPIKAGEFGLVHRHELSGTLSGLFRVRVFTQDDAHIFCAKDQIKEQIIELLELVDKIYSTFGFKYHVELSTKPKKAMGDPKIWEAAENSLANALKAKGYDYKINPGDGAFYGPKIDFHLKDAIGRTWQCGTIQLDFSMPEKFDLNYEGADGKKHRPVMLHRAIYGSFERFIGILIEHFEGKFPLWISPKQVKIVTVTDRNIPFAKEIKEKMKEMGIRAELDLRTETMGKKIRDAQIEKVNYIVTIGDKEENNKTLAIRSRSGKIDFGVEINDFISQLTEEINKKEIN